MLPSDILYNLEKINTSSKIRTEIFATLISENNALEDIIILANENKDISAKAMRAVETVARETPNLLFPYINLLIKFAKTARKDDEIRPISKIFECLAICFSKNENVFSSNEIDSIIPICFDWLISNQKPAAKAQSMVVLSLLMAKREWIRMELKLILEKEFPSESPGYKARARMILKKLR